MAARYYRVKKDNFMWLEGAILKSEGDGGYRPISDIWNNVDLGSEYISSHIIEDKDNAEWFERVHEVSVLGKAKYLTREKARQVHNELFNSDNKE